MKHYSKNYLYYKIVISIFVNLFLSFSIVTQVFLSEEMIKFETKHLLFFIIIFIVIQVIKTIYDILAYKYIYYEMKDDLIILKKGIIYKRVMNLKYEKIHAIDVKQNIIHKLFKIKRLAIDSGSTTKADQAEIIIFEDEDVVSRLERELKLRQRGELIYDNEEENFEKQDLLYKYSREDKISFILISAFTILLAFVIVSIFAGIVLGIFVEDTETLKKIILASIALVLAVVINSTIISALYVLIRYYDYQVIAKDDHLVITHGLITKVSHLLNYSKIKAIKIEEGFIKRLFKYATVKLEVVGFGESSNDDQSNTLNYLIPLCKKDQVKGIIERLDLKFEYTEKAYSAPKRAFRYFVSLPIYIFSFIYFLLIPLILLIEYYIVVLLSLYFALYLLVILLIILNGYLKYKNSGIYFDNKKVIIYCGSFNKQSLIVLNENITELEVIDTYCRRKKGLASFNIHFFNNAIKNEQAAALLDNSILSELQNKLKY